MSGAPLGGAAGAGRGLVELSFRSELSAPPARVWSWITSADGIARELRPLLRMTMPRQVRRLQDAHLAPGRPLFRSWLLLFGILPIDRSDLTLLELVEGRGFVEESPMLALRRWRHERTLEPRGAGTVLTDRLAFEPRLASGLTRWFVETLFRHRHAVLRRHLGP